MVMATPDMITDPSGWDIAWNNLKNPMALRGWERAGIIALNIILLGTPWMYGKITGKRRFSIQGEHNTRALILLKDLSVAHSSFRENTSNSDFPVFKPATGELVRMFMFLHPESEQ